MKKVVFVLAWLVLLGITVRPAQASGRFYGCATPFYGYSAPVYVPSYYAPVPRFYYAPAPRVYYAPPVYCPPPAYYSPYYYRPPVVNFSFGFGSHGYHHPYHRHSRW
jgi:hypothetical protein